MLTPEQEKWLAHLSDQDHVTIIPFDPTAQEKFKAVKAKIQAALGDNIRVEHRGATDMGISGQDEIDIYVPVPEDRFNALLAPLTAAFGKPRSHYPLERARFVTFEAGKHVDIFLDQRCVPELAGWEQIYGLSPITPGCFGSIPSVEGGGRRFEHTGILPQETRILQ